MEPHHVQVGNSDGQRRRVRVVHISDTHRRHAEFTIPNGDILVHSGNFDSFSAAKFGFTQTLEEREISKVAAFFDSQPHSHKVFVPGSHDIRLFSYHHNGGRGRGSLASRLASSCHVLIDSGVTLCGLKFYGIPWFLLEKLKFGGCPVAFWEGPNGLLRHWRDAPADTDVLVTHIPLMFDQLSQEVCNRIKPLALLHGQDVEGNGFKEIPLGSDDSSRKLLVSNASMKNTPRPVVIDFYLDA